MAETHRQVENLAPYALFGDVNGDVNGWVPTRGEYTLRITPYSERNGQGRAGRTTVSTFTVSSIP